MPDYLARKTQICVEASSSIVDSSLVKSWSLYMGKYGENFFKKSSEKADKERLKLV